MFRLAQQDAAQAAAINEAALRVAGWTREQFRLPADCAVMVSEVACSLPGCPPLETVIAFWFGPQSLRHHLKVFKPLQQVQTSDLPPYWMREALAVPADFDAGCC